MSTGNTSSSAVAEIINSLFKVAMCIMSYQRVDDPNRETMSKEIHKTQLLALRLVDYDVTVDSGMGHYKMRQYYKNPLNHTINLKYKFPMRPSFIINGFRARIGADKVVEGVIKEKEETNRLYEEHKKNGSTVSRAYLYEDTRDIMQVDLGNLGPLEEVVMEFEFSSKIQIFDFTKLKLVIPSTLTPRYISPEILESEEWKQRSWSLRAPNDYRFTLKKYPWVITVNFKDSGGFRRVYSPTHGKEIEFDRAGNVAQVRLGNRKELLEKLARANEEGTELTEGDSDNEFYPNKNFELVFEDLKPFRPQADIVTFNDYELPKLANQNQVAGVEENQEQKTIEDSLKIGNRTVSRIYPKLGASLRLVPDFYKWKFEMEAEGKKMDAADFDVKHMDFLSKDKKYEFYFLIDTSRSMYGQRIENAKQALKILIQSLPANSKYNIVPFDSVHTFFYGHSISYTQEAIMNTLGKIDGLQADGGTEMLPAFLQVSQEKIPKGYQRLVFLITDGAIGETEKLIESAANEYKRTGQRVFGVGIGSGASEYLVKGAAKAGQGSYLMISDNEDPRERLGTLLADSLTPWLSNFEIKYDPKVVVGVAPKPSKNTLVTPNRPLDFQVLLDPEEFEKAGWKTLIEISYLESSPKKRKSQTFVLDLSNEPSRELTQRNDAVFRVFAKNCLDNKEDCYRGERINKANDTDLRLALEYGVIHAKHTSFLCVIKKREKTDKTDNDNSEQIEDYVVPNLVEDEQNYQQNHYHSYTSKVNARSSRSQRSASSVTQRIVKRNSATNVQARRVTHSYSASHQGGANHSPKIGRVKIFSPQNARVSRRMKRKRASRPGSRVQDVKPGSRVQDASYSYTESAAVDTESISMSSQGSSKGKNTHSSKTSQSGLPKVDQNSSLKNVQLDDKTRIEVVDLIAKYTTIPKSGPLKGKSLILSQIASIQLFGILRTSAAIRQKYEQIKARIGLNDDEFFTAFVYVMMRNDPKLRMKGVLLYRKLADSVSALISDEDRKLTLYNDVGELLNA